MQENGYRKRIFTIPNILSFFRILMIPLFIRLYTVKAEFLMSAYVIMLSAATDVADGFIARRYGMESDLGKVLDPLADKLWQSAMCICLSFRYPIMIWALVFFGLKEITLGVLGYRHMRRTGIVNSARWYGKASSIVQYGVILGLILHPTVTEYTAMVLIGLCIATHLLSLVFYIRFYVRSQRDPDYRPVAMRPIDWSVMVMYLLWVICVFLFMFTAGDSYLHEVLPTAIYAFLRLAAIVGLTGIPAFFLGERIPRSILDPERFPFRIRRWEDEGRIYRKFGIDFWKTRTLDMSRFIKRAFPKQDTVSRDIGHLRRLVQEMCSAELVHWCLILTAPLYVIFIEGWLGYAIAVGYIISNLCSIMIQRYNRPRIQSIIKRLEKRHA